MKAPTAAIGLSAGAIAAFLIANGEPLVAFLQKLVELLSGIAGKSSVGFWSVPVGLIVGWLMTWFLRTKIPDSRIQWVMHLRMLVIELLPMAACFLVVTALLDTRLGAILGLATAMFTSLTYRVVAACGSAIARRIYLPPKDVG
jgi:hypothetical protein